MSPFEAMPWLWPIVKALVFILVHGKIIIIAALIIFLVVYLRKKNKKKKDQGEKEK